MKNSNLLIKLSCLIPALLILCMINLKAQNELIGYTFLLDYAGSSYYLSNCEATWEEANEAATEMGGYLATFTEYNEIYFLLGPYGVISSYFSLYYGGELTGLWFGLRGENGIYEWANGEPSNSSSWNILEPIYTDGAALIRPDWEESMGYLTSNPVSGETEYIVEFPHQPNCSNNPNKAYVCHNGNTICVNITALQAHLDHGDLEGPCGPCNTNALQSLPDDESELADQPLQAVKTLHLESADIEVVQQNAPTNQMQIFPNPAFDEIRIVLPEVYQEGTIRILSLTGQVIYSQSLDKENTIHLDLSDYNAGMYMIDVQSAAGHFQRKFVKL